MRKVITILIMLSFVMSSTAFIMSASAENRGGGVPILKASSAYNCKIYLKWTRVKNADGYEVFSNGKLVADTKKQSYKIRKLKNKKRYKVKVRSYKNENGQKKYSRFSKTIKLKAKYRKPKVCIVQTASKEDGSAGKYLRQVGFKVDIVTSLKKADPQKYDALILPGGKNDIKAELFGQKRHPASTNPNVKEDKLQIAAVKKFKKAKKPIFGICRGEQVINVALGGTLRQNLILSKSKRTYEKDFRKITTVKGTWINNVYGKTSYRWFYHHQAVDKLGKGLIVSSWSTGYKNKFPQSIEHETLPIYGVQWHPEIRDDKERVKLLKAFRKVVLNNMAK